MGLWALAPPAAVASEAFTIFESRGLPRSEGMVVRLSHPPAWKRVAPDDELALAELRGPHADLLAILQVARGRRHADMAALCQPERARTMLMDIAGKEPGTRVTDVVARSHQGRAAYEVRYERNNPPDFLLARSIIVCLKDSRLVVSCAGAGEMKTAVARIEPVCRKVLDSLAIDED